MKIRGSDPFLIFGIISVIFAIASTVLSFIDNEVAQLLSKVFAIVSLVTGVLNIVVNFQYIIEGFATGLQNIGQTLTHSFDGMMALFKNGVEGFVTGVTAILGKAVTGISLNMSYNKALTTFGLNSDLAGITSAFLAGGFSLESPSTGYFSLTNAFSNFTLEGVRFAGKELGLDPTITGIIGTSAATIVSAGLGGVTKPVYEGTTQIRTDFLTGLDAISYTIGTTVLPNVASELAYYGITKLGEAIGIDSIVSQIAGIGIRSTISAGLRGYNANDIFKTALGGMAQGLTSIGINYATQELGLNPLLANLGFSAIASAINAGIQAATGGSQDVFKTFFDTYINNALTFLGYGNITDPNYAWLEASYKQSIIDFSDIIRKKPGIDGLIDALNTYGTSFFNSTTVGAIAQSGMTIGRYFADKLNSGQGRIETKNGKTYTKVAVTIGDDPTVLGEAFFEKLTNPDGSYIWTLVGKGEYYTDHTFWSIGVLGKDSYGNLGFWNDATLIDNYYTFTNIQHIDDGDLTYANVQDLLGNDLIEVNPLDFSDRIQWNAYGEFLYAKLNDFIKGDNYTFDSNNIFSYNYNVDFASDTDFSWLTLNGLSVDDLSNFRVSETSDKTGKDQYLLEWKCGSSETIPSNWIEALKTPDAKERIINGFQGFGFFTNSQISQDFERKAILLKSAYNTGAVITVTGRGASANFIKKISGGPWNHTAMLYVDNDGTKWALEMQGPTPSEGLRKVALNDWLATYRTETDNISIGELSDPNIVADLKNTIERDLFYWEQDSNGNMKVTGEVVPIPYDSANLVGLHWSGYTCSSLIAEIYKHAGHPLFELHGTDWQYQYSPKDVYERLELLGHVD
jgi:hypothetical protein